MIGGIIGIAIRHIVYFLTKHAVIPLPVLNNVSRCTVPSPVVICRKPAEQAAVHMRGIGTSRNITCQITQEIRVAGLSPKLTGADEGLSPGLKPIIAQAIIVKTVGTGDIIFVNPCSHIGGTIDYRAERQAGKQGGTKRKRKMEFHDARKRLKVMKNKRFMRKYTLYIHTTPARGSCQAQSINV